MRRFSPVMFLLAVGLWPAVSAGATNAASAEPVVPAREMKFMVYSGRVRVTPEQLAASGGRVLATYGPTHAVGVPLAAVEGFSQRIQATGAELRGLPHGIHTPGGFIDPSKELSPAAAAGVGLFVLQYAAPATPEWQAAVRDKGVVAIQPLPERAAIVVATRDQITALAREPWVEYAGPYLAEHKFSPAAAGQGVFTMQVAQTAVTGTSVALIERRVGGFVTRSAYGGVLTARFRSDFGTARSLLAEPLVLGVETYVDPQPSDERQALALTGAANITDAVVFTGGAATNDGPYRTWLNRYGFTPSALAGSGIIVDIADTGIDMGCYGSTTGINRHNDLVNGIVYNNGATLADSSEAGAGYSPKYKDTKGHGTVVAGIVAGSPSTPTSEAASLLRDPSDGYGRFYYGVGVAPGVRLGNTIMMTGSTGIAQVGTVKDWTTRAVSRKCITQTSSLSCPDATTPTTDCAATVQNHSNNEYTSDGSTGGVYTTNAREFDISVRMADHVNVSKPLAITASAGNIGQMSGDATSTVLAPATAKNVISVGAVETFRTATDETSPCSTNTTQGDNPTLRNASGGWTVLAYGSRRGTVDNRVKPDILAPATLAAGPLAHDGGTYCFQSAVRHPANSTKPRYHGGSGTSFAAPVAAGSIALLRHFYGGVGLTPSPAMYKSMLVAGARSIRGGYDRYTASTVSGGLNAQTTFGVIGLEDLFSPYVARDWRNQDRVLLQAQAAAYTVTVSNPTKPVKIVVAWTDAAGATSVSKTLVNDLDMKVDWPDGRKYYGNAISATTGYSFVPGCGRPSCGYPADGANNVEMLNIDPALFGTIANRTFTLSVTASLLNGVGVPGASGGANNQDFALFVINGSLQNQ